MTSPLDRGNAWSRFLDERLRGAVGAAVSAGDDPADALRGLYISDEQALELAAAASAGARDERLLAAAVRLGLDDLDSAALISWRRVGSR